MSALDDFRYRVSFLDSLNFNDATPRLREFWRWLKATPETNRVIEEISKKVDVMALMPADFRGRGGPPKAASPEEIAAVGFAMLEELQAGKLDAVRLPTAYNVRPSISTTSVQEHFDTVWRRFLAPAIAYIEKELRDASPPVPTVGASDVGYPPMITESLQKFRVDHPDATRTAFVMMPFGTTRLHEEIVAAVRSTLHKYGLAALRADDKQYHDDLFPNVMTYMYGCAFGVAIFERLLADEFNPNVSLEVGYMRGLRKKVCLLKDRTLRTLPTDLVGSLYRSFDPQAPGDSIPAELSAWLRDKDIITV